MNTSILSNTLELTGTLYEQTPLKDHPDITVLVVAADHAQAGRGAIPFYVPVEFESSTIEQLVGMYGPPNEQHVFQIKARVEQVERQKGKSGAASTVTVLKGRSIQLLKTVTESELRTDRSQKKRYGHGHNHIDLRGNVVRVQECPNQTKNNVTYQITEVTLKIRLPKLESFVVVSFFNQAAKEALKLQKGQTVETCGMMQHKKGYLKVKTDTLKVLSPQ